MYVSSYSRISIISLDIKLIYGDTIPNIKQFLIHGASILTSWPLTGTIFESLQNSLAPRPVQLIT